MKIVLALAVGAAAGVAACLAVLTMPVPHDLTADENMVYIDLFGVESK